MNKWKIFYTDFNGFIREYVHYGDLANLFNGSTMLPDCNGSDSIIKIEKAVS